MLWIKRMKNADLPSDEPEGAAGQPAVRQLTGERQPQEDDLHYCERRIAEEEHLAHAAGSWEAGLVHDQTAMLYRAQLASLLRLQAERDPAR